MDQFLLVKVKSADPFERGQQYGTQAKELIQRGIAGYRRHFQNSMGKTWEEITEKSACYLPLLEQDFPQELEEAKGIAAGSGVPLKEILALNCRYEILKLKKTPSMECTTAALLPEATGGPVYLVQNWDYRPWVKEHSVIISLDDCQGTRILGMTEAGQLLRNGMNSHGVALCSNNLTSIYDTGAVGYPVTFTRRKALSQTSYEALRDTVVRAKVGVSCNYIIGSVHGLAQDLEVTPGKIFTVFPDGGILTHANHMVAGAAACTNKGKKFRDKILRTLLEVRRGSIDLPYIKGCMSSHQAIPGLGETYPEVDSIEAVCTHVPKGEYDPDHVWATIASAVYDLTNGVAYICKGNPCCGEYVPYQL